MDQARFDKSIANMERVIADVDRTIITARLQRHERWLKQIAAKLNVTLA